MTVYEIITQRIIDSLSQGTIPWRKPWIGTNACVARTTGRPYGVLNQMLLGKPGEWATYKGWTDEGGQVRKGEKASVILTYFMVKPDDKQDANDIVDGKKKFRARYMSVFHISQVDGVQPKHVTDTDKLTAPDPVPEAERVLDSYLTREGIRLSYGGNQAYYAPFTDSITLPPRESFKSAGGYYSTAYHEAVHSTGHESRLGRLTTRAAFGSEVYSKEELTAEVGAAFALGRLGIENADTAKNSNAYCQNWLSAIKGDSRLIIDAAARAEKAVARIFAD